MKSLFFSRNRKPSTTGTTPPASPHHRHRRRHSGDAATVVAAPLSPLRQTFSATMMEENFEIAEHIVTKWDLEASSYTRVTSIFHESREEGRQLLDAVSGLQRAMLFFASHNDDIAGVSKLLVRGQALMKAAVRRLEHEFNQILKSNRDRLDPESVSTQSSLSSLSDHDAAADFSFDIDDVDEIRPEPQKQRSVEQACSTVTSDLRAIAETMVSSGYGKECAQVYRSQRKSAVEDSLVLLGFPPMTHSQIQKLNWASLEPKIKTWLAAARPALESIFGVERDLIDQVFPDSNSIQEALFADITREAATKFFFFPESVAMSKECKHSSEKLFRVLDLYSTISDLWPEFEFIFSFHSTASVRNQALAAWLKLAEVARTLVAEFETAIQKEPSKTSMPGCGVHPLSSYVMNYISFLADYEPALTAIFADYPFEPPANTIKEQFFESATTSLPSSPTSSSLCSLDSPRSPMLSSLPPQPVSSIAARLAWLVLVLLCKLNSKTESYKDVALSYLFLANNLHYVVNKVRIGNLRQLIGDDWISRNSGKAWRYLRNYTELAWGKVAAAVPVGDITPEIAAERIRAFNFAFEEACKKAEELIVADSGMKEEIKAAAMMMILPSYRGAYERWRPALRSSDAVSGGVVRFAPEDVKNRIHELFSGSHSGPGSITGSRFGSQSGSFWSRLRSS